MESSGWLIGWQLHVVRIEAADEDSALDHPAELDHPAASRRVWVASDSDQDWERIVAEQIVI